MINSQPARVSALKAGLEDLQRQLEQLPPDATVKSVNGEAVLWDNRSGGPIAVPATPEQLKATALVSASSGASPVPPAPLSAVPPVSSLASTPASAVPSWGQPVMNSAAPSPAVSESGEVPGEAADADHHEAATIGEASAH